MAEINNSTTRLARSSDVIPCAIDVGLYLGSHDVALNKTELIKLNITHVLIVARSLYPAFPDDFLYKKINVRDTPETNLAEYFDECFTFIDDARSSEGGVLVHCRAGISRSATIILAYLMKRQNISLSRALSIVRSKRPVVSPNQGFIAQLKQFEKSLGAAMWEPEEGTASTTNVSCDNLASLYSPPLGLMYPGSFEKAKLEASGLGKWLLINLQSNEEFSSHMLNRDTWSNETVEQTIRTNFIFWQGHYDTSEGKKVSNYYHLLSYPAVLVIDPITGQKMHAWSGMVQPRRLLDKLIQYLDKGPKEHNSVLPQKSPSEISPLRTLEKMPTEEDEEIQQAIAASMADALRSTAPSDDEPKLEKFIPYLYKVPKENNSVIPKKRPRDISLLRKLEKALTEEDEEIRRAIAISMMDAKGSISPSDDEPKPKKHAKIGSNTMLSYPPIPEEPNGSKELLCRVAIRLPSGRRIQRNFLRVDSIKLLWSFVSLLDDGEARHFHFIQAIPGGSNSLVYESNLTFEEAGLSNSMISLCWD